MLNKRKLGLLFSEFFSFLMFVFAVIGTVLVIAVSVGLFLRVVGYVWRYSL